MKVMAFKKIAVLQKNGMSDPKSYIAAGDLCDVGEKNQIGLYPVTYPTSKGGKTRWVRSLTGFLCNQNDYGDLSYPAPGYLGATVKSGGCGVCASVNAVGALTGKCIAVRVMRDLAVEGKARVSGGTNMQQMMRLLKNQYKIQYRTSSSVYDLRKHLEAGGVAICNTAGKGMFSTGGHYVTALGLLDGKICIADSGIYAGKYSTVKRRPYVTVSGDLIFATAATLDADCIGRYPRYYLLEKA
jgi:hypothetical protein